MTRSESSWTPDSTRILTRSELDVVFTDLDKRGKRSETSRRNRIILRLAASCGLRASEIAGIRLRDVKLGCDRPVLEVPRAVAKGGKGRTVPLHWDRGNLADLRNWKAERIEKHGAKPGDPFVCAVSKGSLGTPLERRSIRRAFLNACRALGPDRLSRLTTHDGRHSFCTHAIQGGKSLIAVQKAMGHSSLTTTTVYSHLVEDNGEVGDLFAYGPRRKS